MTVRMSGAATLPVGGRWVLDVAVTDDAGYPVADAPTVTVTRPDGTTAPATVTGTGDGGYRAVYVTAAAGRHVAAASTSASGAAAVAAVAYAVTGNNGLPDRAAVVAYLGATSATSAEIDDALAAELDAQRAVCRVGAVYTNDLRQALLRRVARNLALRGLPLAVLTGDAELGSAGVLPGRDPEVRRLEAPYRRLVLG